MEKLFNKSFVLIFILLVGTFSYSQTTIEGGIYEDTTLTVDQSPYIVTDDLIVFPDITLTIEPGVILKFDDDKKLEIRGKLNAIGNEDNHIVFTSNSSNPMMGSWKGIVVIGNDPMLDDFYQVRMDYVEGYYAHLFIDLTIGYQGPYIFTNSYFSDNMYVSDATGYPYSLFENCDFLNNNTPLRKQKGIFSITARNCSFIDNFIGVEGIDLIEDSYFSGNELYGIFKVDQIKNCTLENHEVAVRNLFNATSNYFVGNTLRNNQIGIIIMSFFNNAGIEFRDNILCDNSLYNVELETSSNVNIPYNCWCSSDPEYIGSKIYDGYDNVNLGIVNFTPFLDCKMGIEDTNFNNLISLYPNPATDKLYISNLKKTSTVRIISADGKQIIKKTIKPNDFINISELQRGVYLLILDGNSYKFIKN